MNPDNLEAYLTSPEVEAFFTSPAGSQVRTLLDALDVWRARMLVEPRLTARFVGHVLAEVVGTGDLLMRPVRLALEALTGDGDALAAHDRAQGRLWEGVCHHARPALEAAALPLDQAAEDEAARVLDDPDAIFAPDERFAVYLEGMGDAEFARLWRERALARAREARLPAHPTLPLEGLAPHSPAPRAGLLWTGWYDVPHSPDMPWLRFLAGAVWKASVRGVVERDAERDASVLSPALLLPLSLRLGQTGRMLVIDTSTGPTLVGRDGSPSPLVPLAPADLFPRSAEGVIGTVGMHRTIRWLVQVAHEQYVRDERGPVVVIGGWQGLAELLDMRSKKAPGELRELFEVLVRTTVQWDAPDGHGAYPMLGGFHLVPHAPGRRAVLHVDPPKLLSPGLVHLLSKGHPDRALVPVLPLPPMGELNPYWHPAAARLDWLAMAELTERAHELTEHGGAALDWQRLATEAGLDLAHLPTALGRWTRAGPDGPARWTEVAPGRWTLADVPETAGARALLAERGELVTGGRKAGKTSAKRKRARLTRKE